MFTKKERSGFKYWFAHWCAFNMTALNLKVWKPKYLFHDIEKPWLKLILRDYKKVQGIHRRNNRHHLQYKKPYDIDWEALAIDWECSRFTKTACPRTAREEMKTYRPELPEKTLFETDEEFSKRVEKYKNDMYEYKRMEAFLVPVLNRLGI